MKKKIYVADDDPSILEVCSMVLEDEGYEVETSPDGRSIQHRDNNLPDMVFLDIMMSGTSGDDICRSIKSRETTKNIPVVLISANRNINEIATQCGADATLPKPFDIDKLVQLAERFSS
jgi:CheY-like chemotaxis protein